jgi:hypothetical protein
LQAIAADVFFLSTFTLHKPNVVMLDSPMRTQTVTMHFKHFVHFLFSLKNSGSPFALGGDFALAD